MYFAEPALSASRGSETNLGGAMKPAIVYSRHYDIGIFGFERLHPFDTHKYGRAYKALKRELGSDFLDLVRKPQKAVPRQAILTVHTQSYLKRLKQSSYVAGALEMPLLKRVSARIIDWCILRPMRWATAGTILAAHEAMKTGLAVNLSGGYHHAKPDGGEGFCIYNDIALAINDLRQSGDISPDGRIAYIDLDAHQGNGVCHAFFDDSRVFIFDMYNQHIYPAADAKAKRRIDCPVPLSLGCSGTDYRAALESKLPTFLDAISRTGNVSLAIYNAGTDIIGEDKLGGMIVSANDAARRDEFVIDQIVTRRIPLLILPSGGYSSESYKLIASMVSYIVKRYGNPLSDARMAPQ